MKIGTIKDLNSNPKNQDDLSNQVIPLSNYNANGLEKENSKLKKLGFFDDDKKVFSENQKFHIYISDEGDEAVELNFHLGLLYNIRYQNMEKVIERLNSMLEKDLNGTRIDEEDIMENTFQMFLGEGVTIDNVFDFLYKDGFRQIMY